MICKYCGAEIPDGSAKCDYCGAALQDNSQPGEETPTPNYQQSNGGAYNSTPNGNSGYSQNQPSSTSNNGEGSGTLGVISLILGILSIMSCCSGVFALIMGILAIVLACMEKKKNGIRTGGLITGIIGTLICLVIVGLMLVGKSIFTEENMTKYLEGLAEEVENSDEYQEYKDSDDFNEIKDLLNQLLEPEEKTLEDTSTNNSNNITTTKNDWAVYSIKDGLYVTTYTNGISDSYMLSDKGSFKNVAEWLEYAIPGYPTETFRKVLSLYYLDDASYKQVMNKTSVDQRNYTLASLASLAWQINNDFGSNIKYSQIDPVSPSVTDYIIDSNLGYTVVLRWDSMNKTLQMKNINNEKFIDYVTTTFEASRLAPLMVAVENALNGEIAD